MAEINCSCKVGIYEKAIPEAYSVMEALKFAKEAGFDFYEINIDKTDFRIARLYDKQFSLALRNVSREMDMPIGSLGLSALSTYTLGHCVPEIEKEAIDIFKRTLEFADRIGIRMIQIPACDVPKNGRHSRDTDQRFFENVMAMSEYAAAYGIIIGVENMEDEYMNSVKKCMRLINAASTPYVQLYPDSGNITRAFPKEVGARKEDIYSGQGHILGFHLKETREGKFGGLFYGEGDVDFPMMVRHALSVGARRFMMEYWYTGNATWKDDLKTACQLCHGWISSTLEKGTVENDSTCLSRVL